MVLCMLRSVPAFLWGRAGWRRTYHPTAVASSCNQHLPINPRQVDLIGYVCKIPVTPIVCDAGPSPTPACGEQPAGKPSFYG